MATANKKIALITGGNAGIGFEIAAQLLKNPEFHILLGSRSLERGNAAIQELQSRKPSGSLEVVSLDVGKEDSIASAAQLVQDKYGHLDALVNNAGIMRGEGSLAIQMQEFFTVNTLGPALMGQYFNPLLQKAPGTARIVHVTSGAGSVSLRLDFSGEWSSIVAVPYRVSKAGQNMIFATQSYELRDTNVKVFLYGPGPTQSRTNTNQAFKSAAEGARPVVEMVMGERDGDTGKFLHYREEDGSVDVMGW